MEGGGGGRRGGSPTLKEARRCLAITTTHAGSAGPMIGIYECSDCRLSGFQDLVHSAERTCMSRSHPMLGNYAPMLKPTYQTCFDIGLKGPAGDDTRRMKEVPMRWASFVGTSKVRSWRILTWCEPLYYLTWVGKI